MIQVTPRLFLDERDIEMSFVRSSGPGGQNVNKVSSAVQLRFDILGASLLPEDVRDRLRALAGQRLTQDGVIVIQAQRFRSQELNKADAMDRLLDLIREAALKPIARRPTRPTLASRRRRLEAKASRSNVKGLRRRPAEE